MKKYNIGYCCGVWDIGHMAHIKFLQRAKEMVNILIVGVVNDAAVKDYKGKYRPILLLHERMDWVDSLKLADEVVYQSSFDPSYNLEVLRPNVFIKGEDQQHIKEDQVNKLEITIEYLKRTPGISTSEIIERIRK